jgi:hypothetical protein
MGELAKFQKRPDVKGYAVDLLGGGKLVLFTEAYDPTIAKETDAILQWLGTPKGFTVNLWWRDDPRYIEADGWPSRRTVNGGWTYQNSTSIVVYRSEEWDRVLIHEVIHAMGWDWNIPSVPLKCWNVGENAILQPSLLEAWTELYAEWIWCGWRNVPWEMQRGWQDEQAVQILARRINKSWEEDTSVFAYYVLKAALAPHISFLLCFGGGETPDEKMSVLCGLVTPELERLRTLAKSAMPKGISLRMSKVRGDSSPLSNPPF